MKLRSVFAHRFLYFFTLFSRNIYRSTVTTTSGQMFFSNTDVSLQLLTILTQVFVHITLLTLIFYIPYRGYIGYFYVSIRSISGQLMLPDTTTYIVFLNLCLCFGLHRPDDGWWQPKHVVLLENKVKKYKVRCVKTDLYLFWKEHISTSILRTPELGKRNSEISNLMAYLYGSVTDLPFINTCSVLFI
jgi:hypothetical protein